MFITHGNPSLRRRRPRSQSISIDKIASAAHSRLFRLVPHWLPCGRRVGNDWVVRNSTRNHNATVSFKINLHTGIWEDFATGAKGGDAVSLLANLHFLSQQEAA
jgi:putative DNA primase/helicase